MKGAVAQLCQQLEVDTDILAAALLYQVQQERPLQLPPMQERQRDVQDSKFQSGEDRGSRRRSSSSRATPTDLGSADVLKDNPDIKMCRYMLEVGRDHGVGVGNIVGAIANEANIDSRYIGQIQLFDQITTVDLPAGMPKDILVHLRKVRVCGRPINIKEVGTQVDTGSSKPRRSQKQDEGGRSRSDTERSSRSERSKPRAEGERRPKRRERKES
jgi:ATP-dependent RNA helicase DeaD